MLKKKQLFYLFYIFCSFALLVCGEENILPNLTNSRVFLAPWSWSRLKKKQEPGPLGEKIRSRSHVKKKSVAGAAKKFASSPALVKIMQILSPYQECKPNNPGPAVLGLSKYIAR